MQYITKKNNQKGILMLENTKLTPISGTFINMIIPDTGITNAGLAEWEQDFQMLQYLGIDKIFVIRTEFEQYGRHLSAEDPRSTTWNEDRCLLDMVFRLADKYNMTLFLGGPVSISNLHKGDWRKEIDESKRYYERTVAKYAHHKCFKGIYISLEALPWHFNFLDICTEMLKFAKSNYPDKKTFMSPSFDGVKGDFSSRYTPQEWCDIYGKYFFDNVAGLLNYCAPQDTLAGPFCKLGEIESNGLNAWYPEVKKLFDRNNIELWSNVETFQRAFAGHGEGKGFYRQSDYRTLYMKLAEATPFVKNIVTYDFFTCMSPNTEWASARRLLARYMEMIGLDTDKIKEIYG